MKNWWTQAGHARIVLSHIKTDSPGAYQGSAVARRDGMIEVIVQMSERETCELSDSIIDAGWHK